MKNEQTPHIVVIRDNIVDVLIHSTKQECEKEFMRQISIIDESVSDSDMECAIEDGYWQTEDGSFSVCLTWA